MRNTAQRFTHTLVRLRQQITQRQAAARAAASPPAGGRPPAGSGLTRANTTRGHGPLPWDRLRDRSEYKAGCEETRPAGARPRPRAKRLAAAGRAWAAAASPPVPPLWVIFWRPARAAAPLRPPQRAPGHPAAPLRVPCANNTTRAATSPAPPNTRDLAAHRGSDPPTHVAAR